MTVLVTGSTGFLGMKVVERLLAHGVEHIRCFARPSSDSCRLATLASYDPARVEVTIGNLQNRADIDRALAGVDTVYHLAGRMTGAPAAIFRDTVVASKRLLERISTHPIDRVVLASSVAVYGLAGIPADRLVDESTELEPHPERRDVYSHAKVRQELLFQEYADRFDRDVVMLRPGPLYGPGGPAFPARVGLAVSGRLLQFGGNNLLPLSNVLNCAEAVALAGTSHHFSRGAYNVVDDDLPTVAEYVCRYRQEVARIRSIRCPLFATMLLSRWAECWHVSSGGRAPLVLTPYRTTTLWRGHRFDNGKLRSTGWRQILSTRDALAGALADLRTRHEMVWS
jgi:nucleoside-diphosphate-sugar epimerase